MKLKKIFSFSHEGNEYLKLMILGSIPLPIIALLFIDIVSENLRTIPSIATMTVIFAIVFVSLATLTVKR